MNGYILSPDAEADIFEIWSYLAREVSVALADQVESELFDDFSLLAGSPGIDTGGKTSHHILSSSTAPSRTNT